MESFLCFGAKINGTRDMNSNETKLASAQRTLVYLGLRSGGT